MPSIAARGGNAIVNMEELMNFAVGKFIRLVEENRAKAMLAGRLVRMA